jgi:hypothetical protein
VESARISQRGIQKILKKSNSRSKHQTAKQVYFAVALRNQNFGRKTQKGPKNKNGGAAKIWSESLADLSEKGPNLLGI